MMKESSILKKIMLAIGCRPDLRIWRNNTGQLWSGQTIINFPSKRVITVDKGDVLIKGAYPVRFGLEGSADILGVLAPSGRFFAIEVKQQKGKQSQKQKNFAEMIKLMGGIYIVAHSPEEAQEQLDIILSR